MGGRNYKLIAAVMLVGIAGFAAGILAARVGLLSLEPKTKNNSPSISGETQPVTQMLYAVETDTARRQGTNPFLQEETFASGGGSLRFTGSDNGEPGRVIIPIQPGIDIGAGDFTIEFWLRARFSENGSYNCQDQPGDWAKANILIGSGDGSSPGYGVALANGRIAFGVQTASGSATLCGATFIDDNRWHHVALTRSALTGNLSLFIDGLPDGVVKGPPGEIKPTGSGEPAGSLLVIGAGRPDLLSFDGWIDEIHISRGLVYTTSFTRPVEPFVAGPNTLALFHLDEGQGGMVTDYGGMSTGSCRNAGLPAGPEWWNDTPFGPPPMPSPLGTCAASPGYFLPLIFSGE